MKNLDPFSIEVLRDHFAQTNKNDFFLETYKKGIPEIKNLNTTRFWDSKLSDPKRRQDAMALRRIDFVAQQIKEHAGKFLNVGIGSLDLEKKLSKFRVSNTYGVDTSKWSVKNAKQNVKGTFIRASIFKLPFKDSFFHTINISEVLEHLPPTKTFAALREIHRVARPKAIILVSVPLNEGLEEMVSFGLNPNGHMRAYTPSIIQKELEVSGFTIIKVKFLYAFNSLYWLKDILRQILLKNRWKPNNIILVAQKK